MRSRLRAQTFITVVSNYACQIFQQCDEKRAFHGQLPTLLKRSSGNKKPSMFDIRKHAKHLHSSKKVVSTVSGSQYIDLSQFVCGVKSRKMLNHYAAVSAL